MDEPVDDPPPSAAAGDNPVALYDAVLREVERVGGHMAAYANARNLLEDGGPTPVFGWDAILAGRHYEQATDLRAFSDADKVVVVRALTSYHFDRMVEGAKAAGSMLARLTAILEAADVPAEPVKEES